MKIKSIFIFVLMALLLANCGGKKVQGFSLKGNVSAVHVVVNEATIPADRLRAIKNYKVVSRLQNGVTELLKKQGKYALDGTVQLEVEIIDFRLRSGASAFFLGAMAGGDFTAVDVTVIEDGVSSHHFSTSASTARGGMFSASPTHRVNVVSVAVSKRIVAKLY
jgi:hypothetical protein